MKNHYDFSDAQLNPYANLLRSKLRIMDEGVLDYFREIFEESRSVFEDEAALLASDLDSEGYRVLLGASAKGNVVVVRHLCRESEDTIEISSTRIANQLECKNYTAR